MKVDIMKFEEAYNLVKDLDFALAVEKLQTMKNGGWTKPRALKAVEDYKKYLAITKALDGYQMVPNADVDEIWHYHILDTRRYFEDCQNIFGGFLHHYPYFGMLNAENEKKWKECQDISAMIWNDLFGEELYDKSSAQKCPQACPCNKDENGLDFSYKKTA